MTISFRYNSADADGGNSLTLDVKYFDVLPFKEAKIVHSMLDQSNKEDVLGFFVPIKFIVTKNLYQANSGFWIAFFSSNHRWITYNGIELKYRFDGDLPALNIRDMLKSGVSMISERSDGKLILDSSFANVVQNQAYLIQWRSLGVGPVKIEYYNGSAWSTLSALCNNTGSYSWTPSTSGTDRKIKISNVVAPDTYVESAAFSVTPA